MQLIFLQAWSVGVQNNLSFDRRTAKIIRHSSFLSRQWITFVIQSLLCEEESFSSSNAPTTTFSETFAKCSLKSQHGKFSFFLRNVKLAEQQRFLSNLIVKIHMHTRMYCIQQLTFALISGSPNVLCINMCSCVATHNLHVFLFKSHVKCVFMSLLLFLLACLFSLVRYSLNVCINCTETTVALIGSCPQQAFLYHLFFQQHN